MGLIDASWGYVDLSVIFCMSSDGVKSPSCLDSDVRNFERVGKRQEPLRA